MCQMMMSDLQVLPEQLRHAADLLEAARCASSRTAQLALLGAAREICERLAGELAHWLDPHGEVVGEVLEGVRRRSP